MESNLEEDNIISVPPGYYECKDEENNNKKVMKMNKEVYGLIQASKFYIIESPLI